MTCDHCAVITDNAAKDDSLAFAIACEDCHDKRMTTRAMIKQNPGMAGLVLYSLNPQQRTDYLNSLQNDPYLTAWMEANADYVKWYEAVVFSILPLF